MPSNTTKTEKTTAFLVVYEVTRHYGGPEEGGWWYDRYHHTGVAIPFRADVTYEATLLEDKFYEELAEAKGHEIFREYDGAGGDTSLYAWEPQDINPDPEDLEWYRLANARLTADFDLERLPQRYSMAPRGEDYQMFHEMSPGARAKMPRPRYE